MNLCLGTCFLSILSLSGTTTFFLFVAFSVLRFGLATVRLGTEKIWLDRNVSCTPFATNILPTIASSQGNCVSLGYYWEWLWGWEDSIFCTLFGMPLVSLGLCDTARSIYCLSQLKPDMVCKRIFFK